MKDPNHDLPAGLCDWIEATGGGQITRLQRHVARREAWIVDVTAADGSVLEGFLRLDRNPVAGGSVSLRKEARICEALMDTGVPAPRLLGWSEAHHAALFSRDGGRSDIDQLDDKAQQRAIMEDFIRVIARLHQLDLDDLGLDDILGERPQSPQACALEDVDNQLSQYERFLSGYADPLLSYGVHWLRRFAPEDVARVSLVQGDTGPVNFMFTGNRVSVVVDWEWGHWGDPMEDLGNICVREFWNPSGGLKGLFQLYEQESGLPYRRFSAQYYRVQQNIRSMIPIHAACAHPPPGQSLAWYLCYRYLMDRSTCEALADAMDIEISPPEMPVSNQDPEPLTTFAVQSLKRDALPRVSDTFAVSRIEDAVRLMEVTDRRRRFGAAIEATEAEEMAELLQTRVRGTRESTLALVEAVNEGRIDDEALIQYLARRAYRDEWLHSPVGELYPDRAWSPLD